MCHELGHVIGLNHNYESDSCMKDPLDLHTDAGLGYNATDTNALVELYYSHYPG